MASLAALRASEESAAYCASKAGAVMLTQCIARDYGPRGVRANAVCPAWTRSDMADASMDELAGTRATDREGAYTLAHVRTAPRRARPRPPRWPRVVAWLLSPEASYVNGAAIPVDGGAAHRRRGDAGVLAMSAVAGIEVSPDHFIGGRREPSAERFEVISPIDGRPIADVARGGRARSDMAVAAAQDAFPAWAALGAEGRAQPTCAGWPT